LENENYRPRTAWLPWLVSLILLVAFLFFLVKYRHGGPGLFETALKENEVLSSMRLNLFRAAEAEKSAVLAITDEESKKFADQSQQFAQDVATARQSLTPFINQENSSKETSLVNEFDRCWTESTKLDGLLLNLAVQNTNLHAANLALTRGTETVRRLEAALTQLADSLGPESRDTQSIRLIYQAIVASLKIHDLYTPHIQAETDEKMDKIEKEIKANEKILKNSLDRLTQNVIGREKESLRNPQALYTELAQVTDEIIALSRKNTNIKSLELSLGKKRLITAQCDEILKSLQETVQRKEVKATR
jgi:hypothetical protein